MTRTITTAAELDALPVGSVVLDHTGDVHQKFPANTIDPERWASILDESRSGADMVAEVAGAFTVLHAPSATREAVARAIFEAGAAGAAVEFGLDGPVPWSSLDADDVGRMCAQADALLACFTITPRTDR